MKVEILRNNKFRELNELIAAVNKDLTNAELSVLKEKDKFYLVFKSEVDKK